VHSPPRRKPRSRPRRVVFSRSANLSGTPTVTSMNLYPDIQAEHSASSAPNTPATPPESQPGLTAEMNEQIDAAMRQMDAAAAAPPPPTKHDPKPPVSGL